MYGDGITGIALTAIEKKFSDKQINESLAVGLKDFISQKENFRSMSNGIKEQLRVLSVKENDEKLLAACCANDDAYLLRAFRKLMVDKGVNSHNGELEGLWFKDERMPSKDYAIKMCFAFGLSDISKPKTAGEFLFNVCQINGFNYRVAEDIIFYHSITHDEDYEYAARLIAEYKEKTANVKVGDGCETSPTEEVEEIFKDLAVMSENAFMEKLVANAHNFIGYNKTARSEFVRLYDELSELILEDIKKDNAASDAGEIEGYDNGRGKDTRIYDEIIFDGFLRALTAKRKGEAKKKTRDTLTDILDGFPAESDIGKMRSTAKAYRNMATGDGKTIGGNDFHHGYARKAFILCFFNAYILDWKKVWDNPQSKTPVSFFNDFYRRLNSKLRSCSYAAIYPANPFDWLILKCAKLLDEADPFEDVDITEIWSETLKLLGENS